MRLAEKRLRFRNVRILVPLSTDTEPKRALWSRSLLPQSLRVVERELSVFDPPAVNIDRINAFRPDVISGTGSYIEALFVYLHETGQAFHRPRLVTFGGEPLSDQVRQLITERFGIAVLGGYGATEAFDLAFECEQHQGYHLNTDLYPVRIIDAHGRSVPDGERGEVVISNLIRRGTVLLNYRLGDVASKLPRNCPCGRSLPLLSFLVGRASDWVEKPSGELLHSAAVMTLFTYERDVWRYRVFQRANGGFSVSVVPAADCDHERLRTRLTEKFVDRLGAGTVVDVSFVQSLPRTRRGKVLSVVSIPARRKLGVPQLATAPGA
jgi:phenylacetate-CoA ligase